MSPAYEAGVLPIGPQGHFIRSHTSSAVSSDCTLYKFRTNPSTMHKALALGMARQLEVGIDGMYCCSINSLRFSGASEWI